MNPLRTQLHDWQEDGVDPHKGAYWYKCAKCGASDWIASYGTMDQLSPSHCTGGLVKREVAAHAVFVGDELMRVFDSEDSAVRWHRSETSYGSGYIYTVQKLYTQATLNAAVAEEKKKWVAAVLAALDGMQPKSEVRKDM